MLKPASVAELRAVVSKDSNKLPVVYSREYNISFWGLESAHPFDTQKYGRVFKALNDKKILVNNNHYEPLIADSIERLINIHKLK